MTTHRQLPSGASALLLGLVVGLLGSFSDDVLGAGTAASVVQIALWVVSAALILSGAFGLVRAGEPAHRGRPVGAR